MSKELTLFGKQIQTILSPSTVLFCRTEEKAKELEANGKIVFTMAEIEILKGTTESLDTAMQRRLIKAVHAVKRTFPGSRVQSGIKPEELNTARRGGDR